MEGSINGDPWLLRLLSLLLRADSIGCEPSLEGLVVAGIELLDSDCAPGSAGRGFGGLLVSTWELKVTFRCGLVGVAGFSVDLAVLAGAEASDRRGVLSDDPEVAMTGCVAELLR